MNKIKKSIIAASIALTAIFVSSCSNDEATPAESLATFEMQAVTTSGSTVRSLNTGMVFTEVMVGVTEVEFETFEEDEREEEEGEDESEEVEYEGAFQVDLLTGTSNPDFGFAELASGVYEEVEIEFGNVLASGNTISVKFNFQDSQDQTVFVEFSTRQDFELEMESDTGFSFDQGALTKVLVTLNLDVLFASLDFSSLQSNEAGIIVINEESNAPTMEAIIDTMETALEAEEDNDEEEDEADD